jgi:ribosome-binding protein aMBF1 (putative translation factor)
MTPSIKTARLNAGLTQKQLADKINSYSANISEMESGKFSPNLKTLKKISNALNVTFEIKPDLHY